MDPSIDVELDTLCSIPIVGSNSECLLSFQAIIKSSHKFTFFSNQFYPIQDLASMNLTEKDEGKRVQETEEQGDDEDIFSNSRVVLGNLETSISSESSNMDFIKLNETLQCIHSYLVNFVDEVLLDDVAQG